MQTSPPLLRQLRVKKDASYNKFPPPHSHDALLGVNGSAGKGHNGSEARGLLDEEMIGNDEDEPDD